MGKQLINWLAGFFPSTVAPENWLEDEFPCLGFGLFSGVMFVSGSVVNLARYTFTQRIVSDKFSECPFFGWFESSTFRLTLSPIIMEIENYPK